MRSLDGTRGKPGIVMMSPHTTTTKPAPAAKRTSRMFIECPEGAPSSDGSVENEYWVLAMHTGRWPYPSVVNSRSRVRTLLSAVTSDAP